MIFLQPSKIKLLSATGESAATRPTTSGASGSYATSGAYQTGTIRTRSGTDRLPSLQPNGKSLIRLQNFRVFQNCTNVRFRLQQRLITRMDLRPG